MEWARRRLWSAWAGPGRASLFARERRRGPEVYRPRPWLVTVRTTPFGSNCYLLRGARGGALVVDPGSNAECIIAELSRLGAAPTLLLGTHGHFDHIGNASELQRRFGAPCLVHPSDEFLYRRLTSVGPFVGIPGCRCVERLGALRDREALEWESTQITVLHTPGHTPGGCCFSLSFEGESLVFTGDTLFRGAIGRTDIERSDHSVLVDSVRRRLFSLPAETVVFPGHGRPTTIGAEIASNPLR